MNRTVFLLHSRPKQKTTELIKEQRGGAGLHFRLLLASEFLTVFVFLHCERHYFGGARSRDARIIFRFYEIFFLAHVLFLHSTTRMAVRVLDIRDTHIK